MFGGLGLGEVDLDASQDRNHEKSRKRIRSFGKYKVPLFSICFGTLGKLAFELEEHFPDFDFVLILRYSGCRHVVSTLYWAI
jgi:hypothetical protein